VPAELGPEVWPQLAALQAQAVAARTYARAHLGQFEEQGFDLCATPRCQVYAGAAAEHALSNRAVWSTRGEILEWEGRPIEALYTATCGGHTEAGAEIFPEQAAPYLRGVPCRAEGDAVATRGQTLTGRRIATRTDETGADVTRAWALLETAGVIPQPTSTTIDGERLRALTAALARLAGLPPPAGDPPQAGTVAAAAVAVMADLGWDERARVLLSNEDALALLREPELAALPEAERRALAYLAWAEALKPHGDGRFRATEPMSLERLAPVLVRIGESYEAFGLRSANVAAIVRDRLQLVQGKGQVELALGPKPALFGLSGGKVVAVERLTLYPGDPLRFRTSAAGVIDFLELVPPIKGVADDRSAKVYSWEVRRTRSEVEAAIERRVPIGELRDLEVVRRGVSGRVVELKVVGSKGSTVVRGFDVRTLLDLRESLLVIEPQRDERGVITAVVFAGKGWGHGVGLCQVGAYGMALRGATYREILSHYYPGATLARTDPPKG
jgi:stage II sporulation protein D